MAKFDSCADEMSFVREGREDTIFVGGLRKSTIEAREALNRLFRLDFGGSFLLCSAFLAFSSEDKVAAHFAKFGQVTNVEIKKQPDGTSRGFCFVTFADKAFLESFWEL